jgi:hypothetical protein
MKRLTCLLRSMQGLYVFCDLGDRVVLNHDCHGVAAPGRLPEPGDKPRLLPCADRAAQRIKII